MHLFKNDHLFVGRFSGRVVSSKREDLNRILAKMNLQVDNPVCILNQETAKNFLHNSDPKSKYTLFERATQLDQMDSGFSAAEDELMRCKSCLKEKCQVRLSIKHLFLYLEWLDNKADFIYLTESRTIES